MAWVQEKVVSRSGTPVEHTREFIASGYSDEAAAIAAVHAASACPTTIDDLDRVDDETQASEFHYQEWSVSVRWRLFTPSSGLNYSFQIGGTSIFREYANSTASYGSAPIPDFGNAINWDGERVNGVTLPHQSGFEFVIPARKPIADVDNAYVTAVADLYLTVNDATFEGFPAGEVLFLGLSGTRVGENDWQLYYRFGRSKNLSSITVDGVSVTSKEGWDYLWVHYKPAEDGNGWEAVEPAGVYVQSVFDDGDFDGLEI